MKSDDDIRIEAFESLINLDASEKGTVTLGRKYYHEGRYRSVIIHDSGKIIRIALRNEAQIKLATAIFGPPNGRASRAAGYTEPRICGHWMDMHPDFIEPTDWLGGIEHLYREAGLDGKQLEFTGQYFTDTMDRLFALLPEDQFECITAQISMMSSFMDDDLRLGLMQRVIDAISEGKTAADEGPPPGFEGETPFVPVDKKGIH